MEVWVPCNTTTRQNISGNSGFSLDPHNLNRCNARDITITELKTCFTEFLNIQDNQKSTSGFCLSSDRNAVGYVVKKEDGHEDSNNSISSCSPSEIFYNEYVTFPLPEEVEAAELFGGKEIQEIDVTTQLPEINSSVKQSLPTPVKLVSAMKGNREKQGLSTGKLSVTWAPDVYDPVPTSVSHFPSYNNSHGRSGGKDKRHGKNKLKGGSKSLRGSKGKDKKQARKNSGNANKFNPM